MRLTVDVILRAQISINPLKDRELNLRGYKAPAIENLGVTKDGFDCIDLSDNEIKKLENFPRLRRLRMLLVINNQITKIQENLADSIDSLEYLILTGNRIAQLAEIHHLAKCKKLDTLSLLGNPVVKRRFYRQYIIHKLPQLHVLDFHKIRPHERQAAAQFFMSAAGKRVEQEVEAEANGTVLPSIPAPSLDTIPSQSTQKTPVVVPPSQNQIPVPPPPSSKPVISAEDTKKAISSPTEVFTSNKSVAETPTQPVKQLQSPSPSKRIKSSHPVPELTTPSKNSTVEEAPYTPSKPIEQLTVNQLQEALKARGLSTKGLKPELQKRLNEAVASM